MKHQVLVFEFLYDSTWDWTPVSWTINEHCNHYANGPISIEGKNEMSQQFKIYTFCSMNKQYVEGVQKCKKVYLMVVSKTCFNDKGRR